MVTPPANPTPTPGSSSSAPTATDPEYRTINDPALQYAWHYYSTYDKVSNKQKVNHIQHRRQIIILGFTATIVAVMLVLPGFKQFLDYLEARSEVTSIILWIRGIFLVSAPIAIGALMAYTLQFSPSLGWVVHRVGAEKIWREVYLYRMNADGYAQADLSVADKQAMLRTAVNKVREEIEKLDILIPSHQPIKGVDQAALAKQIVYDPKTKTGYTDSPDDDGFSPLSGTAYVVHRVIPQRDWYVDKIDTDYRNLRRTRIAVLTIGGLGAVAAAIGLGWEQYVVVTTALITAITTYVQLRMYGQVYPTYHMTVSKIDAELADWRGVPDAQRESPTVVSGFVKKIEDLFNDERLKWMDQATQAMVNGDQSLMRNVSDWTRGFSNQPVPEIEDRQAGADGAGVAPTTPYLPLQATEVVDAAIPHMTEGEIPDEGATPPQGGDLPLNVADGAETPVMESDEAEAAPEAEPAEALNDQLEPAEDQDGEGELVADNAGIANGKVE